VAIVSVAAGVADAVAVVVAGVVVAVGVVAVAAVAVVVVVVVVPALRLWHVDHYYLKNWFHQLSGSQAGYELFYV